MNYNQRKYNHDNIVEIHWYKAQTTILHYINTEVMLVKIVIEKKNTVTIYFTQVILLEIFVPKK